MTIHHVDVQLTIIMCFNILFLKENKFRVVMKKKLTRELIREYMYLYFYQIYVLATVGDISTPLSNKRTFLLSKSILPYYTKGQYWIWYGICPPWMWEMYQNLEYWFYMPTQGDTVIVQPRDMAVKPPCLLVLSSNGWAYSQ